MKKSLTVILAVFMMIICIFPCMAAEEYIAGYLDGHKYMLDRLTVGTNTENLPEDGEINTDFFCTDMISEVEAFIEIPATKYFTVYLKDPGTANILRLKGYLENMDVIESVELIGFAYTDALLYDVTEDGETTAEDARFVLRCSVGLEEFTSVQLETGDTDGDKQLTAADARNVLRYSVGLFVDDGIGNCALDSLIVKVKGEYVIDGALESSFLYSDMAEHYEFLCNDADGGVFVLVSLNEPGKENLLKLKEYYEGQKEVKSVDFNDIGTVD